MVKNYFSIGQKGDLHIFSDRIPIRLKEVLFFSVIEIIFLTFLVGFLGAIWISFLGTIGFIFFRFSAWVFYRETSIDLKNNTMEFSNKVLKRVIKSEEITNNFKKEHFKFLPITRSGKTKFLLNYKTHKEYSILIIKSEKDKELIENYIHKKL